MNRSGVVSSKSLGMVRKALPDRFDGVRFVPLQKVPMLLQNVYADCKDFYLDLPVKDDQGENDSC